jgi:hypothetical protein
LWLRSPWEAQDAIHLFGKLSLNRGDGCFSAVQDSTPAQARFAPSFERQPLAA